MSLAAPISALERLVLPWTRLPWPVDWASCFGRTAPLGLELGFGNGEFLAGLATARPEMDWVGIEISWTSMQRLAKRAEAQRLGNIRAVQADGAFALEHLFAPASLSCVYVNHPDPWPKARHHERRLVQPRFLDLVARRLAPGGEVTVVTDHAGYAEWIAQALQGQRALAPALGAPRVHALPDRAPTKYERKGVEAGSRIHCFVWKREGAGGPEPPHVETLDAMPNVTFDGELSGPVLLPGFEPRSWEEAYRGVAARARLEAVYARVDGDAARAREWLVEARVQEGGFTQHLVLSVQARAKGLVVLQPAEIGHPRPTAGVKLAVRGLAGLLLAAHPGLAVHTSSVGDPGALPGV